VLVTLAMSIFSLGVAGMNSVIPRLVEREELAAANAIENVYGSTTNVAGPAFGGVLIAVLGLRGAYLLDAATFAASLWSVWRLPPLAPAHDAGRPSLLTIAEGFRFVRRKKVLLGMFLVDSNAMIFGMPRALFPALALNRFHGGAGILGLMYAAPYAGALISSVLSGWIGHVRRQGLIVAIAAGLWGVAIAAFGFAGSLWLALLLLAAAGAADNVSAVLRGTILWTVTPDALRGRVSGIEFAQVAATPALGNVEAGLVASLTSLRLSIVSGGLACVVGTVLVALAVPAFTRYDARAPD
jgi:predicted MFS family arabinose efflux permease